MTTWHRIVSRRLQITVLISRFPTEYVFFFEFISYLKRGGLHSAGQVSVGSAWNGGTGHEEIPYGQDTHTAERANGQTGRHGRFCSTTVSHGMPLVARFLRYDLDSTRLVDLSFFFGFLYLLFALISPLLLSAAMPCISFLIYSLLLLLPFPPILDKKAVTTFF